MIPIEPENNPKFRIPEIESIHKMKTTKNYWVFQDGEKVELDKMSNKSFRFFSHNRLQQY